MAIQFKNHVLYMEYEHIKQICMPLQKLNTVGFIFMRFFNDGTFIDLSNQLEWSSFFLNNFFQAKYPKSMINNHIAMTENISLWALDSDNIIWQEGQQYFNFGNGISLITKKKDYTEVCCFYAKKSDHGMSNFYLSHLHLLEQFQYYFLEQAKPIIKQGMQNKLHIPAHYLASSIESHHPDLPLEPDIGQFLKKINPRYLDYYQIINNNFLSAREEKIIQYSAEGMTAQHVADKLCISRRTVETHLGNLKLKLACKNLPHLVYIYSKFLNFRL